METPLSLSENCAENDDDNRSSSCSSSSSIVSDDACVCCFSSSSSSLDAAFRNKKNQVDLTQEFNQLSIQERNQVYEDVHGATRPIPETPQLLQSSLDAMERALQQKLQQLDESSKNRDKQKALAYRMALENGKAHVQDAKFRLAFLRCERFDGYKAAERYINYFDAVKDIYGPHVLGRPIAMADLGPEELAELKQGHVQFLAERDSAGRAIQLLDPIPLMAMYAGDAASELIAIRACFYMTMRTMLGSVETQRNGVCSVFYGVDGKVGKQDVDFKFPRARFLTTVGRCFTSVPMRVNSVHFVYNDTRLLPFMFLLQFALGRVIRARFQTHHGSALECNRILQSYGIPVSSIPLDEKGSITYGKHIKSLNRYRKRETQSFALEDLNEACQDDEFVDLDLKAKGGLKGIKRRQFIKAVVSAASPRSG